MQYNHPANPGDVKKFKVTINDEDVSDAVVSADIYQDIFAPTWTAQVFFDDTNNLLMNLPIKAGSEIVISVETDFGGMKGDGEKEFSMIIYRIGDKEFLNHSRLKYTIFAAHRDLFTNQKTRIQKTFSSQKPEDIVSSILGESVGAKLDSHESDNNLSLVVPNWAPFNAIAWVCKVATANGAADYCFFQKDDDEYSFKSFEKMFVSDEEKEEVTFRMKPANVRRDGDSFDDFSVYVSRYTWEHFDGAAQGAAGLYKSKTVSFDLINKRWESKTFTYGDDTPKDAEGKNFDDILEGEDSNISFMPKHEGMFEGGASPLDYIDQWVGSRKSAVQKMDMEKLVIQIPGGMEGWKWIGKNVMVDLPSQQEMEDEKLDKRRKGRYVVIALCHNIKKSGYALNLELVKKRLEKLSA